MKVEAHQIDIMITRKVEQYASIDIETALEYGGVDDAIDAGYLDWEQDEYDREEEYHVSGVVQKKQYDDALAEIKKLKEKVKKLMRATPIPEEEEE